MSHDSQKERMYGEISGIEPVQQKPKNLGIVTLSSGKRLVIKEPTFGELIDIMEKGGINQHTIPAFCAQLSIDELKALPFTDGIQIVEIVEPIIEACRNFAQRRANASVPIAS